MRRQILTGKFPTERLPNPENGQRHGYSDLGDHVVAFPNRPEAAPILVVAMNTFQPLGICPICSIGADGYIRGQQGVWALCGERDSRDNLTTTERTDRHMLHDNFQQGDTTMAHENDKMNKDEVEEWLAIRKEAGLHINSETAEVDWNYAQTFDPYGVDPDIPEEYQQVGREFFARSPESDVWVWFGDLPTATREDLWSRHSRKLAFPAGLSF